MEEEVKKQNIFFRLFKLFIWIIVITGIIFYSNYSSLDEKKLVEESTTITIKSWDYLSNINKKFLDKDWEKIIDDKYLKAYIYFNNINQNLQAGSYEIKKDTNISTLFEQLKKPVLQEEISLTFLEWWNIFDIDEYLFNKDLIKKWEFIKYSEINWEWINSLKWKYKFLEKAISLEWFLYPDSYRLFKNKFSPEYLSLKMLDNFENKVYNKILSEKSNEEILKIVNLASIVEKEEKSDSEKPTVAWILKKRLESNWKIWADITVCYPHKLTANECKMVVTKYIREESEYNTRVIFWLPKTPIGSPQFSSINAVVNPNITDYWFYLHNTNSWQIYYWKTNAEHEANKKYLYK